MGRRAARQDSTGSGASSRRCRMQSTVLTPTRTLHASHEDDRDMSLISVEELAARLTDPRLRIVDVRWYLGEPGRGRAAYDEGHLPGAIHLDLDEDLADLGAGPGRHPLPDPGAFVARLGAAGIGTDDTVVAYDDVGGWVASRLWWMLDNLGHPLVSVLDGGIGAWAVGGLPLTTTNPAWPATRLVLPRQQWTGIVDRDELRARLGRVILLDARGAPRYRGETEPIDPVAGHIPTAHNRPVAENLGPDGRFLSPEALREAFTDVGTDVADDRPVVTSCGSGTSACHHALAMRVAGLPDPLLYVGSWSDWSTAGYPVVVGAAPGEAPGAAPGAPPGSVADAATDR